MARNLYHSLIRSFLATSAPDQPPLTEDPGALQFTVGGLTCTVYPLEGGQQLVMQCPVTTLAEVGPQNVASVLRLLHGLNWASRDSTGVVAMVDQEDRVLVSKTLEIRLIDAHQLEERTASLLEAASHLATMLKASTQAGEAAPRKPDPIHHGRFA
jgi:hypothetical protein